KLGAKMIEFVGWDMPVEYKGIIDEHLAVRTAAGLFDVSHMGEILITGKEALAFVQHLTPNDASRLALNQVQYTALTTPQGTFVDDMLVYCLGPERYLLVVNAANTDKDYQWVVSHLPGFNVKAENLSDSYSQLALQGPKAAEILKPLTDIRLDEMKSFWAAWGKVAGIDSLVSRTGYTGEDGFEIYTTASNPSVIWEAILESGRSLGIQPIGLGARDTLRLEAKLMLYGNDIDDKTTVLEADLKWNIDDKTTVLEADLKWIVKFKKGAFLGSDVLLKQNEEGIRRKIVGFELMDRGIARPHYPVFIGGEKVAEVRSGTFAPYLKKSIGLVYLPVEKTELGTEFEIGIRDKKVRARVIPTPFYKKNY
ncbi:MAG: glycine cleavage system aminomethyltransferase GcvT, partial [Candidatus Aminicenantes bacterium]|nr:glycine cleavage system aminomethyltransferase GcvT [Candidatus Aminicenantes bacterium]